MLTKHVNVLWSVGRARTKPRPSLVPRPTPQGGRSLLGGVQLECHGFWIQQTSSFRSSTQLVLYYSNFQNFYVLPYICFLSLVELERWLAGLMFFHSSTRGSILTVKTLPGIVIYQTLPTHFSFPRFFNWGAGEVHALEGLGTRLTPPSLLLQPQRAPLYPQCGRR